jgi:hydroxymethylglutaryl-CoA lyase
MVAAAQGRFRLIGTVSVAWGCPFEGHVDPALVLEDVRRFAKLGVMHVAIGDTTGIATPHTVRSLLQAVHAEVPEVSTVAHFHDTRGTGLVNYVAALDAGCRYFDCAFGGVGGHPAKVKYGGGHTGNVSTEDLVSLFESMGVRTGLDLDALLETANMCEEVLGRPLHSRVALSGLNPLITR